MAFGSPWEWFTEAGFFGDHPSNSPSRLWFAQSHELCCGHRILDYWGVWLWGDVSPSTRSVSGFVQCICSTSSPTRDWSLPVSQRSIILADGSSLWFPANHYWREPPPSNFPWWTSWLQRHSVWEDQPLSSQSRCRECSFRCPWFRTRSYSTPLLPPLSSSPTKWTCSSNWSIPRERETSWGLAAPHLFAPIIEWPPWSSPGASSPRRPSSAFPSSNHQSPRSSSRTAWAPTSSRF